MDIDTFKVEDFFPYYLTQEQKTGLADAFRQFSPDSNIYTDLFAAEILQGDCWENLPYFDYNSSQTRKVKGSYSPTHATSTKTTKEISR
ncbi:hypothetical protein QOT20_18815 [Pseudomonas aeruginosa]|nr:hypothetical protein [Pseudomonas aeruginosa]